MIKIKLLCISYIWMQIRWEMIQYFEIGGFKWLTQNEINRFATNTFRENNIEREILAVYTDCPNEWHKSYYVFFTLKDVDQREYAIWLLQGNFK